MPIAGRLLAFFRTLPLDELRTFYITPAYLQPHAERLGFVIDSGYVSCLRSELLALYPPHIPPEDALRPPLALPCWRFDIDGRWLFVETQEQYDALDCGHSGRPDGPWPDGVNTQVPWDMGQGIYAPVAGWRPYGSPREPEGHPDKRVYATQSLLYYGRIYARKEVFYLKGENITYDDERLDKEEVKPVPRALTPLLHDWTWRRFVDQEGLNAYILDYTKSSGGRPAPVASAASAPTPHAVPGRPGRTKEDFTTWLNVATRLVQSYRTKHRGQDPQVKEVYDLWPLSVPGGRSRSSWNEWASAAVKHAGYSTLTAWIKALPHPPRT